MISFKIVGRKSFIPYSLSYWRAIGHRPSSRVGSAGATENEGDNEWGEASVGTRYAASVGEFTVSWCHPCSIYTACGHDMSRPYESYCIIKTVV
ncbi:hypothetical protein [Prevotella sp. DNF00663]|uniref:hypothetical protein n=1 Tax=Prevotella sp. DNF00663 TaxID=1384078 RepID=UPI0012E3F97D|nr:hypothetical protein [Prevotella sp. DNF00663]